MTRGLFKQTVFEFAAFKRQPKLASLKGVCVNLVFVMQFKDKANIKTTIST